MSCSMLPCTYAYDLHGGLYLKGVLQLHCGASVNNATPDEGLEPATLRLKVWCSTDWANRALTLWIVFPIRLLDTLYSRESSFLPLNVNGLPGGESNPGLPRDRRGYLPLYYRGCLAKHEHLKWYAGVDLTAYHSICCPWNALFLYHSLFWNVCCRLHAVQCSFCRKTLSKAKRKGKKWNSLYPISFWCHFKLLSGNICYFLFVIRNRPL